MTWTNLYSRALCGAAPLLLMVPAPAQAGSGPKKLPVCNGKHLRDVNIYGSVLPGSPIPAIVAPPAPPPVPHLDRAPTGTPPPPVAGGAPDKVSARDGVGPARSC